MPANNDPTLLVGPLSQTCQLQVQSEKFSFTPVKTVVTPRVWDRKPSNAFLARSKSRKVWKRFRSSFNSMKAIQRLVAASHEDVDDSLFAEINVSRGLGFVRGVKRQCFGLEDSDKPLDATATRGRSFLKTKWESEATGRRRKLPANHSSFIEIPAEPMEMDMGSEDDCRHGADNEESRDAATSTAENTHDTDASFDSTPGTATELAPSPAYPRMLHGVSSCRNDLTGDDYNSDLKPADDAQTGSDMGPDEQSVESATLIAASVATADDRRSGPSAENTGFASASVEDLSAAQESTLVRSALRSSLDGDDAELLNNFLFKAQAARAAKAAAMTVELKETKPETTHYQEVTEMPTPPSRRVLEELDANSPSPSKPQLSPVKVAATGSPTLDAPSKKDVSANEDENQQPASPIRRSARNRAPKLPPRTTTPTLRTLSLRRAKGTEFVFLQRTEAQELALTTRRNTRQNRGDAVMPKYVLQALAQKQQKPSVNDGKSVRDPGPKRTPGKKYVTWNDERLVEYEGDSQNNNGNKKDGKRKSNNDIVDAGAKATVKSTDPKAASSRSTRSQSSAKTGDDDPVAASTTAVASAIPTGRRVRRLGTCKANSTPAAATSTTTASLLPAPRSTGETEKRKKLIPKPPSVVVTGTPVSKKALPRATSSNNTNNNNNNTSDKSSDDSTSGRLLGIRSKNILKAHAGSTPMPRRIQSRS
ncbi:uncharacterized protein ACLA_050790 [Aspergillus clavatus NRRL 1]|uniref:Uncharacterized protein n=1 Tax=Aspergillus clavatus (strain ATCC 1007 / CBS 513.65 / DSM 816 / NCTC 3887 / NRRL 1 / QM 1276 / 107) TaxID=344612 RepID=A1CIA2_ASPCL|nr:uncharacterized protein ACLA_050790 [Aspergillus clavatus NRRL 1]EAW10607.1 conserved hypothetical protein [Aspergillus clavatus NRRL 1]